MLVSRLLLVVCSCANVTSTLMQHAQCDNVLAMRCACVNVENMVVM